MTRRQQILEAIRTRLQAIQRANGFQSDVGLKVFMGETVVLGPEDPTEVAVVVAGEDQLDAPNKAPAKLQILLPVECQAVASASLEQPWVRVEAVIADIKKAIEVSDRTLGGLASHYIFRGPTRPMERQEGSLIVGASVTYMVPYTEAWGNP